MPKLSVLAVFIQKQSVIASVSGANGLSLLDTASACPSVGFELVSVYLSPRSLTVKQFEDQIDELASQNTCTNLAKILSEVIRREAQDFLTI